MKKNRFIKIAAVVFTLCLITTCGISSTLAKYTTSSSASDTARVAKWGVEVSASGTMFGKAYGANSAITNADSIAAQVQASVNTNNGDNIVAPGTMNATGIKIKLLGSPEVAFKVSAEGTVDREIWLAANTYGVMVEAHGINAATDFIAEGIYYKEGTTYKPASLSHYLANTDPNPKYYKLTNAVKVDAKYYPIVWTGTVASAGTTGEATGTWDLNYATLEEAVEALKSQINGIGKTNNGEFEANQSINNEYKLTWAWAYENNQSLSYADGADTILGDLIARASAVVKLTGQDYIPVEKDVDYSLSVECNITVSATQIN